ncbi:hypothetical protein SNEBB_002247 [Seison nebaliae]|nr:hypothetical protein SNEBB_002247 [Seison nebaliae]
MEYENESHRIVEGELHEGFSQNMSSVNFERTFWSPIESHRIRFFYIISIILRLPRGMLFSYSYYIEHETELYNYLTSISPNRWMR